MTQPTSKRLLTEARLGAANGAAPLGSDVKIPAAHVPDLSGLYGRVDQRPLPGVGVRYRTLTIMIYHAVNLAAFQTDCDYFQEWNYNAVTFADVEAHMNGTGTLPDKPLLVTFDDGIGSQYPAAQELNTRGMVGTFFICTGWIDGTVTQAGAGFAEPTALTWTQLQQMKAWGHSIQSHTVNHTDQSLTMTQAQAKADFLAVKARIESQIPGEVVRYHAYPYGSCNTAIKAGVAQGGAVFGRTVAIGLDGQYPGPNLGRSAIASTIHDPYCLPTAGTSFSDIMQPNFNRSLSHDPELIPDYGFEAGGKGWGLGSATIDTTEKHSGTRSLKIAQSTGSLSASMSRLIPVGMFCHVKGSVWIKSVGLVAPSVKLSYQIYKPDGVTLYASVDAVVVAANNGAWTNYTIDYVGDGNTGYLRFLAIVGGSGTPAGAAWFDDLSIRRALLPSPLPLPY